MKKLLALFFLSLSITFVFTTCDYGTVGSADQEESYYPGSPKFETVLSSMSGVWYSHNAGIGRLDGYRIGKFQDFTSLVVDSRKDALFPDLVRRTYTTESGSDTPSPNDYFVLYDASVYGQSDDASPPLPLISRTAYVGIVRLIKFFNGDQNRGVIIIEYFQGGAPQWDPHISAGQLPFFGIYYKVLNQDTIQMANPVDLSAMYAGGDYYVETRHLSEAITKFTIDNEAEFISWGIVIPQDRE
jgi:hypothetical protein